MLKISTVLPGNVVKEAGGVASLLLNLDTGCYGLDGQGFETPQGQEIFLYSKPSEPPLQPTEPPIQSISGFCFRGKGAET